MSIAVAEIGHNNPPPTPFELTSSRINDLMIEAKNWLDGEAVTTQQNADCISVLLDDIRKASKALEESRKAEAKPFDDGKAEIQARYKPIANKADLAVDTCKKALSPYLARVEAEKRAIADAARLAADKQAQEAREAMQKADFLNIQARADAEILIEQARDAEKVAARLEKDKASAIGGARAVTLRSVWHAKMTDRRLAASHFWKLHPDRFDAFLNDMAAQAVRSGAREIPGFDVIEERVAQ